MLRSLVGSEMCIRDRYNRALKEIKTISLPLIGDDCNPVWHLYVIQSEERDPLAAHLKNQGIPTVINYPVSLPFLPAYDRLEHGPSDFPNAYNMQSRILSLPIFPEMTEEQIVYVCDGIKSFYA